MQYDSQSQKTGIKYIARRKIYLPRNYRAQEKIVVSTICHRWADRTEAGNPSTEQVISETIDIEVDRILKEGLKLVGFTEAILKHLRGAFPSCEQDKTMTFKRRGLSIYLGDQFLKGITIKTNQVLYPSKVDPRRDELIMDFTVLSDILIDFDLKADFHLAQDFNSILAINKQNSLTSMIHRVYNDTCHDSI